MTYIDGILQNLQDLQYEFEKLPETDDLDDHIHHIGATLSDLINQTIALCNHVKDQDMEISDLWDREY